MKKCILLFVAVALAVSAYSQQIERERPARRFEMNPEAMATAQTKNLQQILQLDSLQVQAVFLMNYSDAMAMKDSMQARAARGEEKRVKPSVEERRARMEVIKQRRALRDEQMKSILTPEQYEKYVEYMKKSAENGRPRGRRPRGEAPQGARR